LSALLCKAGLKVIALDREREVYPLPRAAHFDHEVMRVFQRLRLVDRILPYIRPAPDYEFRNAAGDVLMRFEFPDGSPSAWAPGYMFYQPGVEKALRALISCSDNAEIRLANRFVSLDQDAEAVTAHVETASGRTKIRSAYLVGCDGASSVVRESIGAPLHDYEFDEPWLVIDVHVPQGYKLPRVNLQICDPKRPVTCVQMGPGRHRWEIMLLPDETPGDVLKEDVIQNILAAWGCGDLVPERKAVYRFHGLLAKKWRDGRVLLAGDAAHQMPPFAGQGMCSGIRDAVNLVWKLESVFRGRASPALLDSYQEEREPQIAAIIEFSIEMGRLVCMLDEAKAAARDNDMYARRAAGESPQPGFGTPAIKSGIILAGSGGAGEYFPQFDASQTSDNGDYLLLDDVLGDGPWLISRSVVNEPSVVATLSLSDAALAPFCAQLYAWLSKHKSEAVLVRPDRFVFGTGSPRVLMQAWGRMLKLN